MINTQSCRAYCNVFKMCGYKDSRFYSVDAAYARSPRILLANWMSFGMIVTRLACINLAPKGNSPGERNFSLFYSLSTTPCPGAPHLCIEKNDIVRL